MIRIVCAEDCGNSPKKALLRDFISALAKADDAFILRHLTTDIEWEYVGSTPMRGTDAVTGMLARLKRQTRQEMIIENIITHGSAGAANGTLRLTNGRSYGYCHVFAFSSAAGKLIKRIISYEIRT